MTEISHRIVPANGIRIHCAEAGDGPLVLLVHGFPESWYSWRHQLPALAEAGYHAVAIDVRGYGRSSAPAAVDAYRMLCHLGDNVALVEALGESSAVVVGHDWGAPIAWNSALLRPDVFPLDDLGLQKGIRVAYFKGRKISLRTMRRLGETWRPWRTVASWYLWRSLDPVPVEY